MGISYLTGKTSILVVVIDGGGGGGKIAVDSPSAPARDGDGETWLTGHKLQNRRRVLMVGVQVRGSFILPCNQRQSARNT